MYSWRMGLVLDSFWRAVAYCLHPRVIALSILPLVLMVAASFALGYFFWEPAVAAVAAWLETYELLSAFLAWLERLGAGALRTVFAPLLVLALATPLIVLGALLLVAVFMTPAMVELVAQRRFPQLERKRGGSMVASVFWSFGSLVLALIALVVSLPLWLIPPLVLVLPPLIWGWLTYRVFTYDALAGHASVAERQAVMAQHRVPLLVIGILSGYLGAAPTLLWASGAMFIAMAPLLVPLAIWVYTLVFAFASLWFAHYALGALERQRMPAASGSPPPAPAPLDDTAVIDVPARRLPEI